MVQKIISKCPACGKTNKTGKNFCVYCGAKLTKQNGAVITSGVHTQLTITDTDKTNLKQLIENEKKREIIRYFKNLFKNYSYDINLRKKIYDLIGDLLNQNPEYFMNKLYIPLNQKTNRLLSTQQKLEMEEYILKKFCLYKGERLITSSIGMITIGAHQINGRFYATNRRIIAQGFIIKRITGATGGDSIILGVVTVLVDFYNFIYGLSSPWKKILKREFNEIKPCFGFEFPYISINQIQRKKKNIKFVLKYEYEHKGELKIKTPKLGIIPLKEKDENKNDFKKRRERVLSEINEILNSNIGKI